MRKRTSKPLMIKCGNCGAAYERYAMLRSKSSPNGWTCPDCAAKAFELYVDCYGPGSERREKSW